MSANDFMEVAVPRTGFDFVDREHPVETSSKYEDKQGHKEVLPGFSKPAPKKGLLPPEEDEKEEYSFDSDDTFTFSRKL